MQNISHTHRAIICAKYFMSQRKTHLFLNASSICPKSFMSQPKTHLFLNAFSICPKSFMSQPETLLFLNVFNICPKSCISQPKIHLFLNAFSTVQNLIWLNKKRISPSLPFHEKKTKNKKKRKNCVYILNKINCIFVDRVKDSKLVNVFFGVRFKCCMYPLCSICMMLLCISNIVQRPELVIFTEIAL